MHVLDMSGKKISIHQRISDRIW